MANPTAKLFEDAMADNWADVYSACKNSPELLIAKVDKSDNTILHVAVLKGNKEAVISLVNLIEKIYPAKGDDLKKGLHDTQKREKVLDDLQKKEVLLGANNDKGNTPLHLAAAYGFKEMCASLAKACPYVIGCTNKDGETPYLLSARRGRKDVFLLLDQICKDHIPEALEFVFRKADGNTILHAAINGEFFELAYVIVKQYKDREINLINAYDERGRIPLHILAEKTNAFESGNPPGIFDWILYQCVIVTSPNKLDPNESDTRDAETQENYPPNYETCMQVISIIKERLKVLIGNPNGNDDGNDIEIDGGSNSYPPNYETLVHLLKFIVKLLLVILGFGIPKASKIAKRKKQHHWANVVADELIQADRTYQSQADGRDPETSRPEELTFGAVDLTEKIGADSVSPEEETSETKPSETPFLVAARTGITEIVKDLLNKYPTAIHDMDGKEKNALLLAVGHRQTHVFNLLQTDQIEKIIPREILLQQVDADGNTALHLAAICSDHHPQSPGAAFRMMWEMKWFTFVKKAMPTGYESRQNKKGQTPREVLTATHQELVTKAGEWTTKTSESCSVVAALIATVAFATSATVPGGLNQNTGEPMLKNQTLFHVFAISSLVALSSSVTALVLFLAVLTSRFQESDFENRLPRRLLWGMTTLFMSIVAILVSFCAGHIFLIQESIKSFACPIYIATCLPITYFGLAQVPLYFDLLRSIFYSQPQASWLHLDY